MRCIYCHLAQATSLEHLWPECLGRLRELPPQRDILCPECNSDLGKLINNLFSRGFYSPVLRMLRIRKKRRKRKSNPHYKNPTSFDKQTGAPVLLEVDKGTESGRQVEQIVFDDGSGGHKHLKWKREYRDEKVFHQELIRLGLDGLKPVAMHTDPESDLAMVFARVYPSCTSEWHQPEGGSVVEYSIKHRWSEQDMRGMGMLAYHSLIALGLVDGRESKNGELRGYISAGIESTSNLVLPIASPMWANKVLPTKDVPAHLFIGKRAADGSTQYYVQLFAHLDGMPWWRIKIEDAPLVKFSIEYGRSKNGFHDPMLVNL